MLKWITFILLLVAGISNSNAQSLQAQNELLKKRLPEEAVVLKHLGNHWYRIDIRGQILLYHFKGSGKGGYESITKLSEKSPLSVNRINPAAIDLEIHGYVIEELPLNSQIIEILGHGWYFVESMEGQIYLYHLTSHEHGAKCITLLN